MSARSPFRSHLLQQWTNNRRSPIVVQSWIQQSSEDEGRPSPSSSPSHRSRKDSSRRSIHSTPSHRQSINQTMASVASSSPSISLSAATPPWAASWNFDDDEEEEETNHATTNDHHSSGISLEISINRAITAAKATTNLQNHPGRAEETKALPFSFLKLFSSSPQGRQLIDIGFEFLLRNTGDKSLTNHFERNAWSKVPAFLVAIVHNNQKKTATRSNDESEDDDDDDLYRVLDYSPPDNEEQLQDYASACAATQSAIHSLHSDGWNTEWVTSSLIRTPAFRSLVTAQPTDRIAALVKVYDANESSVGTFYE